MLQIPVLADRITNLTDARYFAAREVEWIGFNMEEGHEQYVSPPTFHALKDWIIGPKLLGEFGAMTGPQEIQAQIETLGLDGVILPPMATFDTVLALEQNFIIKKVIIDNNTTPATLLDDLEKLSPLVNYFLLDFTRTNLRIENLADTKTSWYEMMSHFPCLLLVTIEASELKDLVASDLSFGISLQGGEEEKVGVKSFDEIDELLEAIHVEEE